MITQRQCWDGRHNVLHMNPSAGSADERGPRWNGHWEQATGGIMRTEQTLMKAPVQIYAYLLRNKRANFSGSCSQVTVCRTAASNDGQEPFAPLWPWSSKWLRLVFFSVFLILLWNNLEYCRPYPQHFRVESCHCFSLKLPVFMRVLPDKALIVHLSWNFTRGTDCVAFHL